MKILFVCHANTSRSIMAETLLRHRVEAQGLSDRIQVRSAGVAPYARNGALPSLDARFALQDHGIELPETVGSTDLKRSLHLLEEADLVLAMTAEQKAIVERWPEAAGKRIETLREFVGESGDIVDPATREHDFFQAICGEIKRCLELAVPKLTAEP